MKYLYLLLCFIIVSPALNAQSAKDYSVMASATVSKNAPVIKLHWPLDAGATGYKIYRKAKTDASFGTVLKSLSGTATEYADNTAAAGQAYEYKIVKTGSVNNVAYTGYGYVYAGEEVPAIENRDKIILLIDNDFKDSLSTEIQRLKMDLLGDGWQVIPHFVKKTDKVTDVKKVIVKDYNADATHVKALFMLGHIPVPYSGDYAIDHHFPDHQGAWPADVYYGNMDETDWTDFAVSSEVAGRVENHNIPDDGKFDNDILPSALKLQIGRVDMYNLTAFPQSEIQLMRRYLNKDHNWRVKKYTAKEQGLIQDNFGGMNGEAFAASGYYNFAAMFGDTNVASVPYLKTLAKDSFLWSYGCGGGSFTSTGGVASTSDFVTKKVNTVFTMLFGSYFGDWDSKDNVLRAPLAGDNMTLTNVWSGRPHWNFHHMALGENIGYSTFVTQNDYVNYFRVLPGYFAINPDATERFITPALMGDPTLRMHVVAPPKITQTTKSGASATIYWSKTADAEEYYIYRTDDLNKPFTRAAKVAATDSVYKDMSPVNTSGKNYYMVRASKLQHSGSGTYYNLSQGSIDSVTISTGIQRENLVKLLQVYPNPSQTGKFLVALSPETNAIYTMQVTDIVGRIIYSNQIKANQMQNGNLTIDLGKAAKGFYTLQISDGENTFTQKLIYK
ncbi:MAG: T9SS type A sorting domain-containing protein [Sphingobacteriales bacterium]|nr:MAG: T9SS type A sorting domain-containing protein [Sphingobacteriales bacterium]